MKSLRSLFTGAILTLVLCLVLLLLATWQLWHSGARSAEAQARRTLSLQLAGELRQSSDDLTRLARTYVISGDPKWEQQYLDILDIRNGKKPRPAGYEKIHWDLLAAGETVSHDGEAITKSLLDRMKDAGFTEAEFAKLREAAANSDGLVKTETLAMGLVKGLKADAPEATAERARAVTMMHDLTYHQNKARIMKPVDDFLVALDARTQAEVAAADATRGRWFMVVAVATVGMAGLAIALLGGIFRSLQRRLGAEPAAVIGLVQAVAAGELVNPALARPQAPGSLMEALATMTDRLADMVRQVRSNADGVATASREIAQGGQDLSSRTEQQAASLQEAASSMHELDTTVRRNADSAEEAAELASRASQVAGQGGAVVAEVVTTMQGITESSRRIGDIIATIDGIAFQTNILALNAAVEAARAGEQGRGFAVVASEVRSLAQRSAHAAREIKGLISTSVERVERGTQLVDQAGATMQDVVQSIGQVSSIVQAISAASRQQREGVEQISRTVQGMDGATQQNAALVEESAAAAVAMRRQAEELVEAMQGFRTA